MIIGENKAYRKLPSTNLDMRCVTHQNCGGATSFSTLYATLEVSHAVVTTSLRRCLQHFINFLVRPTSHKIPSNHLNVNKVVLVHLLHLPVGYQTQFTLSGLGSCCLTVAKIRNIWGLTAPLTFTSPLLIPVDILQTLLRGLARETLVV